MAYWNRGGVTGFDDSLVELTGRIVGQRPGKWRLHDGIGPRWIPRQYIRKYTSLGNGYCILLLPQWLEIRTRFQAAAVTHVSTRRRRHRLVVEANKKASRDQA